MSSQDIFQIVGIVLAILAILVPLFEHNIRNWLIRFFLLLVHFVKEQSRNLLFRSILLLIIYLIIISIVAGLSIITLNWAFVLSSISVLFIISINILINVVYRELVNSKAEIRTLKEEVRILGQSRKLELQNIQDKWDEFIGIVAKKPGYEILEAYLKFSHPVDIEKNTLLLGLPEVILKASEGLDLERVAPILKEVFGNSYTLRAIAYDPPPKVIN